MYIGLISKAFKYVIALRLPQVTGTYSLACLRRRRRTDRYSVYVRLLNTAQIFEFTQILLRTNDRWRRGGNVVDLVIWLFLR